MSDQIIRVTARPRDGIDIDRFALALLQLAVQLSERQGARTKKHSMKRTAVSVRDVKARDNEGVASSQC